MVASVPAAQTMLKPTFAKVAASHYVPTNTNPNPASTNTNSNDLASPSNLHPGTPAVGGAVKAISERVGIEKPPIIIAKRNPAPEEPLSIIQDPQTTVNLAGDSRPVDLATAPVLTDDSSTQVSSSDSSAKMVSFDKQSIASGATFGLDEKESLRPDDSASIRATEDEDGPGTGTAGSRVGSDTDARAFSEQLHQIAVMAPRGILPTNQSMRANITFGEMSMNPTPQTPTMVINHVAPTMHPPDAPTPDEKLLEALDSPRDRVYVLKIEQDYIDFLKNEKDTQLVMPETNGFYRLLAHKLADYYRLDHDTQTSSTGSAVVISKSAYCKFPPPLSGLSQPGTQASTPPPLMPARKIMRRGGEGKGMSANSTAANSEGPSKAASEAGGDGTSENGGTGTPGGTKNKAAITREEREKIYAETRLRIFGEAKEAEATEASKEAGDNDNSRSSSASGKKKNRRIPVDDRDDDDFNRNKFLDPNYQHQPQPYVMNGQGQPFGGQVYGYPPYSGMVGSPPQYGMPQNGSPPVYGGVFSPIDASGQYPYLQPQPYPPQTGMAIPGYGQQVSATYDLSAQFQGLQFSQNAMVSPKPSSPSFTPPYQMPPQQAWQPIQPFEGSYQYPQPGYVPVYPDRPMSTGQPSVQMPYQYGQVPSGGFQNGNGSRAQRTHPPPGSYIRPQFNPQTQAFVPGSGRGGGPMTPTMGTPGMPMYNGYAPMPNHMQGQRGAGPMPPMQQHSAPSTSNPSNYSSPRNHHAIPMGNPGSMANYTSNHANSAPPVPNNNGSQPPQAQQHSHGNELQQLAHPLPQPPTNPASSIAKWGTPAHLPAKPPPPQNDHPHKFIEINRGLPPHATIPGLPRAAFTGSGAMGGVNGNGTGNVSG